jgi:hypothetical protein
MATLARLEDLEERIDRELDEREKKLAEAALVDASELARFHGRNWTAENAPGLVVTLVLRACKRYMANPEGFVISRAGDETVTFSDRGDVSSYGIVHFTPDEQRLLAELGGRTSTLTTAQISAHGTDPNWESRPGSLRPNPDGLVPVSPAGKPFPLYGGSGPW